MPTSDYQSSEKRGIDWPAVARTLLMQVVVLLALGGGFIGYVNWSSNAALEEFIAADKPAATDSNVYLQSASPVQVVKGHAPCARTG